MEKAVCYFMTRNIYTKVLASLKSLLKNGNIDKVFLMIEDDEIGFWLPENVKTVNVSRWKEALDPAGPNYLCRWSYMVMMKVMLSRMFPRRKRILSLDVDTIVVDDISDMWKQDISDKYFAGAREWYWTRAYGRDCINAGVLMWNLAFIVPQDTSPRNTRFWVDENGQKWRSLGNAMWLTNLETKRNHQKNS